MSLGERAVLTIDSTMAYGARAMGADIPANSDLVFDVELLKINGHKLLSQEDLQNFKYFHCSHVLFRSKRCVLEPAWMLGKQES